MHKFQKGEVVVFVGSKNPKAKHSFIEGKSYIIKSIYQTNDNQALRFECDPMWYYPMYWFMLKEDYDKQRTNSISP